MMLSTMQLTRITRRREAPGSYIDGVWAAGAITETTLLASVQPLGLSDDPTEVGDQYRDRRKVFVECDFVECDGESPLSAAYEDRRADRVLILGVDYVVEESMRWPTHVEAVVLRET